MIKKELKQIIQQANNNEEFTTSQIMLIVAESFLSQSQHFAEINENIIELNKTINELKNMLINQINPIFQIEDESESN